MVGFTYAYSIAPTGLGFGNAHGVIFKYFLRACAAQVFGKLRLLPLRSDGITIMGILSRTVAYAN